MDVNDYLQRALNEFRGKTCEFPDLLTSCEYAALLEQNRLAGCASSFFRRAFSIDYILILGKNPENGRQQYFIKQ